MNLGILRAAIAVRNDSLQKQLSSLIWSDSDFIIAVKERLKVHKNDPDSLLLSDDELLDLIDAFDDLEDESCCLIFSNLINNENACFYKKLQLSLLVSLKNLNILVVALPLLKACHFKVNCLIEIKNACHLILDNQKWFTPELVKQLVLFLEENPNSIKSFSKVLSAFRTLSQGRILNDNTRKLLKTLKDTNNISDFSAALVSLTEHHIPEEIIRLVALHSDPFNLGRLINYHLKHAPDLLTIINSLNDLTDLSHVFAACQKLMMADIIVTPHLFNLIKRQPKPENFSSICILLSRYQLLTPEREQQFSALGNSSNILFIMTWLDKKHAADALPKEAFIKILDKLIEPKNAWYLSNEAMRLIWTHKLDYAKLEDIFLNDAVGPAIGAVSGNGVFSGLNTDTHKRERRVAFTMPQ